MNRFLLFCFLSLLTSPTSNAQIKTIYVVDNDSRTPIESAEVQNESKTFTAFSDENGRVSLAKLSSDDTTLKIRNIGYKTEVIHISELNFANGKALVYLTSNISSLSEVTVLSNSSSSIFKPIIDLDIHLRPINNSQEVLRMVPGLFIGQHAGGGKAEQIFLRGFDIDHGTDIAISVDGMPVNMVSHGHGQGYADLHFVIPELIQKVDFNKGPYFADKGNFTTAGFVAFKTKDYLENNFIKLEGGQFSSFRGVAAINLLKSNKEFRNQSLYFAGEGSFTKGYFESPQDFNRFNGVLKYHGNITNNTILTATATGFTSKWNASGQIPDRAVANGTVGFYGAIDDTEGGKTSRYNLNTELLTNLGNGATFRNQLFYSKYDFELYSNFTFFLIDPINGDQIRQKDSRNIFGYNNEYQNIYTISGLKTTSKAGIQIRYDDIDDLELSRSKNRTITTENIMLGDVNELNAAAYYSQQMSVTSKLDITAALRLDYFHNKYYDKLSNITSSANSTILLPKINFNFNLNDNVQLYLYNGRGFHSNDTRVAVQQNGKKVLPPAYGSDLGSIFKIGENLVLQSAIWYLWLDQEFIYVGDEGVVEAGGQSQRFGFDASARFEIIKNLYADLDLSLANPRALNVPKDENYLPLAPTFTSTGGLTYRKQYGWSGSLRYRFIGDRPADETNSLIANGYFIADAAINYATKRWEAGISVQNLFDTKWKETQFATETQLQNEIAPVSEIHFTPGTPFFAKISLTINL